MKCKNIGVTFKQASRSCGNNCPPVTLGLVGNARRSFKIFFRNEYKLFLIHLKDLQLTLMISKSF